MDHQPRDQKHLGLFAQCVFDLVWIVYVGWWYLCESPLPLPPCYRYQKEELSPDYGIYRLHAKASWTTTPLFRRVFSPVRAMLCDWIGPERTATSWGIYVSRRQRIIYLYYTRCSPAHSDLNIPAERKATDGININILAPEVRKGSNE